MPTTSIRSVQSVRAEEGARSRASSCPPSAGPRSPAAAGCWRDDRVDSGEQRLEHAHLLGPRRPRPAAPPRPGRIVARSARAAPGSASNAGSPSRATGRSAADQRRVGQLALAQLDAVAAQHARAGLARARVSSSTSRVLPTPDSPADQRERRRLPRAAGLERLAQLVPQLGRPRRPTKRGSSWAMTPVPHRASSAICAGSAFWAIRREMQARAADLRQLQASEDRAQHARERLLDVRALEDRPALPEVPAPARGAVPGLRSAAAR